jgi:hypothetical protein
MDPMGKSKVYLIGNQSAPLSPNILYKKESTILKNQARSPVGILDQSASSMMAENID